MPNSGEALRGKFPPSRCTVAAGTTHRTPYGCLHRSRPSPFLFFLFLQEASGFFFVRLRQPQPCRNRRLFFSLSVVPARAVRVRPLLCTSNERLPLFFFSLLFPQRALLHPFPFYHRPSVRIKPPLWSEEGEFFPPPLGLVASAPLSFSKKHTLIPSFFSPKSLYVLKCRSRCAASSTSRAAPFSSFSGRSRHVQRPAELFFKDFQDADPSPIPF